MQNFVSLFMSHMYRVMSLCLFPISGNHTSPEFHSFLSLHQHILDSINPDLSSVSLARMHRPDPLDLFCLRHLSNLQICGHQVPLSEALHHINLEKKKKNTKGFWSYETFSHGYHLMIKVKPQSTS